MEVYLGMIFPFAGNFAPVGFALCDGSLLSIQEYQALFAILGTTYGGDGVKNFGLPDLRGRTILGVGAGPGLTTRSWAEKDGKEKVTLTLPMVPVHSHTATFTPDGSGSASGSLIASSAVGNETSPDGNYIANAALPGSTIGAPTTPLKSYVKPANAGTTAAVEGFTIKSSGGGGKVVVGNTGGTDAVPTISPFLALNYIIAIVGTWPSRP